MVEGQTRVLGANPSPVGETGLVGFVGCPPNTKHPNSRARRKLVKKWTKTKILIGPTLISGPFTNIHTFFHQVSQS